MVLKRSILSIGIISVLAAALLFVAVMLGISIYKCVKVQKEIDAKTETISQFVQKSKMPLTEESVALLTDERNKLKSAYSRLRLALTSPLDEDLPPENMDSLQFKEKLIQAQKKLREEAKEFSLSLPESIGFTKYETELSESSEIPGLWNRLKILEELVYIMTSSGVVSLDEINFVGEVSKKEGAAATPKAAQGADDELERLRITLEGRDPGAAAIPLPPGDISVAQEASGVRIHDEVTISFKITCTYSKLLDFLYKLRTSPFIFIVEDIDITKAKDALDKDEALESMLQASFLVKAERIR